LHFIVNRLYSNTRKYFIKNLKCMANTKSSKKRILTAKRNRLQNRFYKTSVRTLTKMFIKSIEVYKVSQTIEDRDKSQKILNSIYSLIDKGSKKNIFHKNTAARKKSQLALQLKMA